MASRLSTEYSVVVVWMRSREEMRFLSGPRVL